jgi:flagellar hook protein FlgE
MLDALWNAISGMKAFQRKVDVTSNNIANVDTDGFKKSRVTIQEDESGNPQAVADKVTLSGHKIREMNEDGTSERETSNVDLTEEIVDLIVSERSFEANAKSAQAADELLGTLMNIKV